MIYKWDISLSSSGSSLSSLFSGVVASFVAFSSLASVGLSLASFSNLLLPGFFGQKLGSLSLNGCLVTRRLLLFSSGFFSQSDLNNGQESLLLHSNKSFLFRFIDINNFPLLDFSDLMKTFNSSLQNLGNPECLVDKAISCLDCDERFTLTEEEGQCSRNIATWIRWPLP